MVARKHWIKYLAIVARTLKPLSHYPHLFLTDHTGLFGRQIPVWHQTHCNYPAPIYVSIQPREAGVFRCSYRLNSAKI